MMSGAMRRMRRTRIRLPDGGRWIEQSIDRVTLIHEIVHGTAVPAGSQLFYHGRWCPLSACPDAPWLGDLAKFLVQAVRDCNYSAVVELTGRIRTYGGNDDGREEVGIAKYLQAHLAICEKDYRRASRLLEPTARKPLCVRAAAHNNGGFVWAMLLDPIAACKEFQASLAVDPQLLVARLNLRNLAQIMIEEKAAVPPGWASWADLYRQAEEQLRSVSEAAVRAALGAPFPGYQTLHVLAWEERRPYLSSRLPASPSAVPAARQLLQQARTAAADGDYHRAELLARKAAEWCPSVKGDADVITVGAWAKLEEAHWLEEAEAYGQQVRSSLSSLTGLTTDGRGRAGAILEHVRRQELDVAERELDELLLLGPAAEQVARLRSRLEASRSLAEARERFRNKGRPEAIAKLEESLRQEPRNQDTLGLLLTLEILAAPLPGPDLEAAAAVGTAAIQAFLAGDVETCRLRCDALQALLPSSRVVAHLMGRTTRKADPAPV